jgi:stress-induced morphogen
MSNHFKCEECSIPFEDLRSLNRHKKTYHSEIVCEFCNVKCTDKATYDMHMKEHLNCNICDKVFDKMFKLSRHLKTHK